MKNFRWEEIKLFEIMEEQEFLFGRVEDSRMGGRCRVRNGECPGAWII